MTSKRQQARNERDLQALISSVPGNDRCADCQARNPGKSTSRIFPNLQAGADTARMGELECRFYNPQHSPQPFTLCLSLPILLLVGRLPLHALRRLAPQARNTHIQGQISQHGHMDNRSGRGTRPRERERDIDASTSID
jgi:hypothetical protein